MARDFASAFYTGAAWKQCRASFIAERMAVDGGMCMRCHREPGYIVHHKIYLGPENIGDPTVALNHDNLEYLCLGCHNDEHNGGKALRCGFDEKGRPINGST